MARFFTVFFILTYSLGAWAQGVALSTTALSRTQFNPELRLWNDSFISQDYVATNSKTFGFLGAYLKTPEGSDSLVKVEIDSAFAMNTPLLSYLNFSESYLDISSDNLEVTSGQPENRFQVGRKKSSWSDADARWNMGVWEPVFKWNPLTPERQGLTGIFYSANWENFEAEIMGSPLYLPDQGPSFEVDEEGQFARGNPWFQRPADTIRIWSETSRVEYNFHRPNETQVVFQKTYAGRGRIKGENFYLQGSYAYKPMNQLALGYDGKLDIGRDRGIVDIVTAVQYHRVLGADFAVGGETMTWGLSGIYDQPEGEAEFDDQDRWTRPVYNDAVIVSSFLDWKLNPGWKLSLQVLNIQGGEVEEVGPLANPDRASITRRYSYTQAQSAEISYEGRRLIRKPWRSSLKYTYGDREKFDILRWRGQVHLSRLWSAFAETLLVRSLSEEAKGEMADFENHDRLLVGVGYVF